MFPNDHPLRLARTRERFTLRELARVTGLTHQRIFQIERGVKLRRHRTDRRRRCRGLAQKRNEEGAALQRLGDDLRTVRR